MFNKNREDEDVELDDMAEGRNETIIGASVKVEGDFVSEGNVLVQGVVSGSLKTKGNLRVEKNAKVKADIEAANASIDGQIKGNISIGDNLRLGQTAVIEGDISTKVLSIEPGALLNGHCSVSPDQKESEAELVQEKTEAVKKTKEASAN